VFRRPHYKYTHYECDFVADSPWWNFASEEEMKVLQRFRLARALRHLRAIFETLCTLPRFSDLPSLSIQGQLQASRWKSELASHGQHQVTSALLRGVKRAKQRGDARAHSAQVALWHALTAGGVAVSATEWMRQEYGLEPDATSAALTYAFGEAH